MLLKKFSLIVAQGCCQNSELMRQSIKNKLLGSNKFYNILFTHFCDDIWYAASGHVLSCIIKFVFKAFNKGGVRQFFIGPKLKEVLIGNFLQKSPDVSQKSSQRVQKLPKKNQTVNSFWRKLVKILALISCLVLICSILDPLTGFLVNFRAFQ